MRQLGVLLADFGGLGSQNHQADMYEPAFEAHPGFHVVGVCKDSCDYPDAVRADGVDVVSVCAPLAGRAEIVTVAVEAGRHVLADKPLAATAQECAAIAAAVTRAGTVCLPAHHHRFHPALRSARAAVAAGRVGLPWNIQADFLVAGGDPVPEGELVNFALYPIDVIWALTGLPVRRVHATGTAQLTVLCLDHDRGLTSTVSVGRVGAMAGVQPGGLALHRYRVSGSHGLLLADATKPAVTVRGAATRAESWLDGLATMTGLLDEFHGAVTTGRRAEVGPADALAAQRVVEAAQQSIRTGMPVSLSKEEAV